MHDSFTPSHLPEDFQREHFDARQNTTEAIGAYVVWGTTTVIRSITVTTSLRHPICFANQYVLAKSDLFNWDGISQLLNFIFAGMIVGVQVREDREILEDSNSVGLGPCLLILIGLFFLNGSTGLLRLKKAECNSKIHQKWIFWSMSSYNTDIDYSSGVEQEPFVGTLRSIGRKANRAILFTVQ